MKIALVSCVKTKQPECIYHKASELYISPLFKGMKRYAEKHADRWFILSAAHGLLDPEKMILPYEKTLGAMSNSKRATWGAPISRELASILKPGDEVIFLAGRVYRDNLGCNFERLGVAVTVPMDGMGLGQQLQWLKAAA